MLLLSLFVGDIGDSSCFDTLLRLLLIKILKGVFVEIYRLGSITLRCLLLIGINKLVVEPFEARSNLLRRQQFVHSAPVMS